MTDQASLDPPESRQPLLDPLAEELIGPGKMFETETVLVAGRPRDVFKGAARTLPEIFEQAQALVDRPMIVHDDLILSYAEVFALAAQLSDRLQREFGIGRGKTVAIAMANSADWVVSLIAITALGAVASLVNSRGSAEELTHAISSVGCTLAIVDAERAVLIDAAAFAGRGWKTLVLAPQDFRSREKAASLDPVHCEPDDGALILYTSGTTGRPKGALLSHGALAHAAALSKVMGTLQDLLWERETGRAVPPGGASMAGTAMVLTPMFHLTGMLPVVRGMSLGATIHIMGKWNVDTAFDMIETSGLSRIAFVPTMLWDMIHSPRATPENLAALRHLAYGGGPLNMELVEKVRARMPESIITNTYGQTENTGWACSLSGRAYIDNPQSCGWACPTVDVEVRRDDGNRAGVNEPGELWVRSASVMSGYVGDPEATRETLDTDGWCATGDVGKQDERGIFTILDRKRDMVISGGENIYCAEVERVLFDHPQVREAIAYGMPDPRLGELLAVTVVTQPRAETDEDSLKQWCGKRLALYKVPRVVVLREDLLPRTASGKIDRGTFIRLARATR